MRYFLIDYENTTRSGLSGMHILNDKDTVVVFYNATSTIPIDLMIQIGDSKAKFEWIILQQAGPNALDLQLTAYMGSLIHTIRNSNESVEVYIVSKDNGYNSAIDLALNKFNVKVGKITSIGACANAKKDSFKNKYDTQLFKAIETALFNSNLDRFVCYTGVIENIVLSSASNCEINNKLVTKFGNVDGPEIYRVIKNTLCDYKVVQAYDKYTKTKYDFAREFNGEEFDKALNTVCGIIDMFKNNDEDLSISDSVYDIIDYFNSLIKIAIENNHTISRDFLDKFDSLTLNLLERSRQTIKLNLMVEARDTLGKYDEFYEAKFMPPTPPEVDLTENITLGEATQDPIRVVNDESNDSNNSDHWKFIHEDGTTTNLEDPNVDLKDLKVDEPLEPTASVEPELTPDDFEEIEPAQPSNTVFIPTADKPTYKSKELTLEEKYDMLCKNLDGVATRACKIYDELASMNQDSRVIKYMVVSDRFYNIYNEWARDRYHQGISVGQPDKEIHKLQNNCKTELDKSLLMATEEYEVIAEFMDNVEKLKKIHKANDEKLEILALEELKKSKQAVIDKVEQAKKIAKKTLDLKVKQRDKKFKRSVTEEERDNAVQEIAKVLGEMMQLKKTTDKQITRENPVIASRESVKPTLAVIKKEDVLHVPNATGIDVLIPRQMVGANSIAYSFHENEDHYKSIQPRQLTIVEYEKIKHTPIPLHAKEFNSVCKPGTLCLQIIRFLRVLTEATNIDEICKGSIEMKTDNAKLGEAC